MALNLNVAFSERQREMDSFLLGFVSIVIVFVSLMLYNRIVTG